MSKKDKRSYFDIIKMVSAWILTFGLRLLPFRPPNVEPILAIQMPFTKRFGILTGFIFAFLNIVAFDLVTAKVGLWTLISALVYGCLAFFSRWYFKKRESSALNYAVHAIYATLIYDLITGVMMGPIFFQQSLMSALTGQFIFTIYHLLGNISLALLFSPVVYRYIVANPKVSFNYLRQKFAF